MTVIKSPEYEVFLPGKDTDTGNGQVYMMSAWCETQFGSKWSVTGNRNGKWCCFWGGRDHSGQYRWCFTDEKDLTLFLLRWA